MKRRTLSQRPSKLCWGNFDLVKAMKARKNSIKTNFVGPETAGWGRGLPREGARLFVILFVRKFGLSVRNSV